MRVLITGSSGQIGTNLALRLLANPAYDALLSEPVAFHSLPGALPELLGHPTSTVTQLIQYL